MNLLFSLDGRIGRLSWWLGSLVPVLILVLGSAMVGVVGAGKHNASGTADLVVLLPLFIVIPVAFWINLCVTVKRYHDRGKSGIWFCVMLIPFIGGIWQLVECGFLAGDAGTNGYERTSKPTDGVADRLSELLGGNSAAAYAMATPSAGMASSSGHRSVPATGGPRTTFGRRVSTI